MRFRALRGRGVGLRGGEPGLDHAVKARLRRRLLDLTPTFRFIKYAVGASVSPHPDTSGGDKHTPVGDPNCSLFTCLLYLNDGYEGCETCLLPSPSPTPPAPTPRPSEDPTPAPTQRLRDRDRRPVAASGTASVTASGTASGTSSGASSGATWQDGLRGGGRKGKTPMAKENARP